MKSWIITGGIACGKSTVTRLLEKHLLPGGGRAFSADECVGRLFEEAAVQDRLRAAFGAQVLKKEGDRMVTDRDWLRAQAFSSPDFRKRLESVLHPEVLKNLEKARQACRERGGNLFLAEVPLHYEIGSTVSADLILVVASGPEVQKRRLMERRGLDESIIEQMLRAQWPIEAKVEKADVVIWNDGDRSSLDAQVLTLARQHWQA